MPLRQDREKGVSFSRQLLKIAASLPRAVYLLLAFLDLRWRWRMATPQGRVRSAMAVVWTAVCFQKISISTTLYSLLIKTKQQINKINSRASNSNEF